MSLSPLTSTSHPVSCGTRKTRPLYCNVMSEGGQQRSRTQNIPGDSPLQILLGTHICTAQRSRRNTAGCLTQLQECGSAKRVSYHACRSTGDAHIVPNCVGRRENSVRGTIPALVWPVARASPCRSESLGVDGVLQR